MNLYLVILFVCLIGADARSPCVEKDYGKGSFVCVCSENHCDDVEPNTRQVKGVVSHYTSSAQKYRLEKTIHKFEQNATGSYTYTVHRNQSYQTIIGFGGAFTDAAGINIVSLPAKAQDHLLASYFSPKGIEYTIGRIPMASCDFSLGPYSYDDTPDDFNLTHFALAPADLKYKIPLIQKAISMSERNISIFGSPWSAPAWMKDNKNMTGKGSLNGEPGGPYYKTWANYFVRFLQEYEKHGISLWGLTAQNEPTDGEIYNFPFQAMGFTPQQQRDFIGKDLGPALHENGYSHIKLMMLDDSRLMLPLWAKEVFSDPRNSEYVSGIAVHWYQDTFIPTITLDNTHKLFEDVFILATEACEGALLGQKGDVVLGSWERAQAYTHSIIEDLNHWVTGWTDWNIALDTQGGPNWVKNFVDSPVIVNATAQEFYKQPMFYALGHFSKFVVPGSKRIETTVNSRCADLESVALLLPDDSVVFVIHNKANFPYDISLQDQALGTANVQLEPYSINTFIWWNS